LNFGKDKNSAIGVCGWGEKVVTKAKTESVRRFIPIFLTTWVFVAVFVFEWISSGILKADF